MAIEPLTPDRRRQQTRDYLLRAAFQVFAQHGFHGTSLDEVAAVAGFTKGAVYSNFKNKEDLFLALLESLYAEELAAIRATLAASQGPPEEHLSDWVHHLQGQYQSNDHDWITWTMLREEFLLYALRNAPTREKLAQFDNADVASVADIIAAERRRHGLDSPEPIDHMARVVVALMHGINLMRAVDPSAIDEAFLGSVMSLLARALTTPSSDASG